MQPAASPIRPVTVRFMRSNDVEPGSKDAAAPLNSDQLVDMISSAASLDQALGAMSTATYHARESFGEQVPLAAGSQRTPAVRSAAGYARACCCGSLQGLQGAMLAKQRAYDLLYG